MKIQFLGAAETVTGSRYLIDHGQSRLLVDCGLFQGLKKLRMQNREPFPVEPSSIQAVVLSHAHIDHSGYIPALIKQGFTGKVYSTPATLELCKLLLPDSGYLQEEEARYANRHGYSRHKTAIPLYTEKDGHQALKHFESIDFNSEFEPVKGIKVKLSPNGHILGSSSLAINDGNTNLVVSGDVGRPNDPIMLPPTDLKNVDYLLIESTYGDRRHSQLPPEEVLEEAINTAIANGGAIIIPTFAVGRAQSVMYLLLNLFNTKRIPRLPVYLDSPMAINATEIYNKFHELHRLGVEDCRAIFDLVTFTRNVNESKAIASVKNPKIILSASGMCSGGRVLHHLKQYLPNKNNVVIFMGYQAAGTRGASMQAGRDSVKIHGEYFSVNARLVNLESISAHADFVEMGDWLTHIKRPPKKTFIIHGEPQAQDAFRLYLKDRFGWNVEIPSQGDTHELL